MSKKSKPKDETKPQVDTKEKLDQPTEGLQGMPEASVAGDGEPAEDGNPADGRQTETMSDDDKEGGKKAKKKEPKPKRPFKAVIADLFVDYTATKNLLESAQKHVQEKEDELNALNETVSTLTGANLDLQERVANLEVQVATLKDEKAKLADERDGWYRLCNEICKLTGKLPEASALISYTVKEGKPINEVDEFAGYITTLNGNIQLLIDRIIELEGELKKAQAAPAKVDVAALFEGLTSSERDNLLKPYVIKLLKSAGVEVVMDSPYASLQKLKNSLSAFNPNDYVAIAEYNKLKNDYNALREEAVRKVDPKVYDEIIPVVKTRVIGDINSVLSELGEDKSIPESTSYKDLIKVIVECLLKPSDIDTALDEGQRRVLDALSRATSMDFTTPEAIEELIEKWYLEKVRKETLPTADAENVIARLRAAVGVRDKVMILLEKYEIKDVEKLPAAIREATYAKILEEMLQKDANPYQLTDEMKVALAKSNTLQSVLMQLVKFAKEKDKACERAEADRDTAIADRDSLSADVVAAANDALAVQELAAVDVAPADAVKQMGDALNNIIAKDKAAIAANEATIADCLAKIEGYDSIVAAKDATIDKLYSYALDELRAFLGDIDDSIRNIGGTGKAVGSAVDERIIENDFYGFAEFKEQFDKNLSAVENKDIDKLLAAVKETFVECLKISSATWIDNLVRLYLYARVPFITSQFQAAKVNVDKISIAFGLLEAMLQQVGVKLSYPELFVDRFDPGVHESETIKNITGLVSDIASHVDDEETIVDLFTVGFTVDGHIMENPVVSRLNK